MVVVVVVVVRSLPIFLNQAMCFLFREDSCCAKGTAVIVIVLRHGVLQCKVCL